ncbi:MAG TPA: glycosyltransferase family 4 protein [Terriglobales bacterium]|nr:glycosyltransferase family 4 protein [Terriglobales bacterium]
MRVALIAPPFIPVPPKVYGGTELFIAHLAEGLREGGIEPVVYCNGESTVNVERRWMYERGEWPIRGEIYDNLKDMNHTAWAVADARKSCDLIHLNNASGLVASRFATQPFVYTIHHPHNDGLSSFYECFPQTQYVTISEFQRRRESMPRVRTIHHGIDVSFYSFREKKQPYVSFIGRIAPIKGTHLAIAAAQRAGVPLKIAGEVQPVFRDYFEREIKPHIDGTFIEYIGEADLAAKNELLGNSRAMLFPVQWDEPFGLVMVEAMACGTPVLALPGGSVREIVAEGISGYVCKDVEEMAARIGNLEIEPGLARQYVEQNFSLARMVAQYAELYREILEHPQPPAKTSRSSALSEQSAIA